MKYKIYKLLHPITKDIFYIGITTKTLEHRLKAHRDSMYSRRRSKVDIYMLKINIKPAIIELIKETDDYYEEGRIISEYSKTHKLYNVLNNPNPFWKNKNLTCQK